ncbi:peptidase M23, partial [Shouchella clausii]
SAPSVASGAWTRPASGRLSSGFGNRSLGNHFGVDIASGGTVPIVAAADGVVIRSYYSSSYGNAIFIAHSVGGQTYTTVYA